MKRRSRAFTLIELLAVISIIGLLAAIALTSAANARKRAYDAKVKTNVASVHRAIMQVSIAKTGNPKVIQTVSRNIFNIPRAYASPALMPMGDDMGYLSNNHDYTVTLNGTYDLNSTQAGDPGAIVKAIIISYGAISNDLLGSETEVYYYASAGGNIPSTVTIPALRATEFVVAGKLKANITTDNINLFNGASTLTFHDPNIATDRAVTLPGLNTDKYFVVSQTK